MLAGLSSVHPHPKGWAPRRGLKTALLCPLALFLASQFYIAHGQDFRVGIAVERFNTPLRGVRVQYVEPGSSAAKALSGNGDTRLLPNDVILRIDGDRVEGYLDAVRKLNCGSTVVFRLFRAAPELVRQFDIRVVLSSGSTYCSGLNLDTSDSVIQYPFVRVKTVEPGSPADTAGLLEGDLLLEANGRLLFGRTDLLLEEINKTGKEYGGSRPVTLRVNRGSRTWDVDVPLQQTLATPTIQSWDLPSSAPAAAPQEEPTKEALNEKVRLIRTAIMTVQRTLVASGIELPQTGQWDAATVTGVTRALAELKEDELWGLGWKGPKDGVYTKELAEHLRLTLDALHELDDAETKEARELLGPFLDALDLLKLEGLYKE